MNREQEVSGRGLERPSVHIYQSIAEFNVEPTPGSPPPTVYGPDATNSSKLRVLMLVLFLYEA